MDVESESPSSGQARDEMSKMIVCTARSPVALFLYVLVVFYSCHVLFLLSYVLLSYFDIPYSLENSICE